MLPGRRLLIRTASHGGDRKSAQLSSLERTRARTFTLKLLVTDTTDYRQFTL